MGIIEHELLSEYIQHPKTGLVQISNGSDIEWYSNPRHI
jgi:hypothetical protein